MTFLLILFFSKCKHECRVVKSTFSNNKDKEVLIYPNCDDTTYYKRQLFHKNGQMQSEGYYRNGHREGRFKSWAENGNQTADWSVIDGKEHGHIQCWYDNGIKKRETTLDHGIENGFYTEWYDNGKLSCEGNYLKGKKEGVWRYIDTNDGWKIRTYKNDSLWGATIEHLIDSTGLTIVVGQYENGKEIGVWKFFDKDSILSASTVYQNGKLNGEQIEYYFNGKVKSKGVTLNDYYEGEVKYFNENGKLTKTEIYKDGELLK